MKYYLLCNKKHELDARNAISIWSCVKWILDTAIIIFGGGLFLTVPDMNVFSFVFILWLWSLIKEITDTPLVILWIIGKYKNDFRPRKIHGRTKNV
jgi:hypothetical protein